MSGSRIRLYGSTSGYVELEAPAVAPDGVLTLPATTGAFGGLVAVKHAIFTGTQSASVTAGGNVAVTDLTITHEVADPSNKLIISAVVGVASDLLLRSAVSIFVAVDGTPINVGDADGSRPQIASGTKTFPRGASNAGEAGSNPSLISVYTPGAGSKTYTLRALNPASSTQTLVINRTANDTNNQSGVRAVSSLVIQEVSV